LIQQPPSGKQKVPEAKMHAVEAVGRAPKFGFTKTDDQTVFSLIFEDFICKPTGVYDDHDSNERMRLKLKVQTTPNANIEMVLRGYRSPAIGGAWNDMKARANKAAIELPRVRDGNWIAGRVINAGPAGLIELQVDLLASATLNATSMIAVDTIDFAVVMQKAR
jgi:hypothetical protein